MKEPAYYCIDTHNAITNLISFIIFSRAYNEHKKYC